MLFDLSIALCNPSPHITGDISQPGDRVGGDEIPAAMHLVCKFEAKRSMGAGQGWRRAGMRRLCWWQADWASAWAIPASSSRCPPTSPVAPASSRYSPPYEHARGVTLLAAGGLQPCLQESHHHTIMLYARMLVDPWTLSLIVVILNSDILAGM